MFDATEAGECTLQHLRAIDRCGQRFLDVMDLVSPVQASLLPLEPIQ